MRTGTNTQITHRSQTPKHEINTTAASLLVPLYMEHSTTKFALRSRDNLFADHSVLKIRTRRR